MKRVWNFLSLLGMATIIIGGLTAIACLIASELVPIENKIVIGFLIATMIVHVLDMEDKVDRLRSIIRKLKERR